MKRAVLVLVILFAAGRPLTAAESASPHQMLKPDGEADLEKCGTCHEPDMSLSRSKFETCTLCHSETGHSGAYEHLHAAPAAVSHLMASVDDRAHALPLRNDGGIYCGTCHLFHDPRLNGEPFLASRRPPTTHGFAKTVEDAVTQHGNDVATKYGESATGLRFAGERTKALRLQVDDGTLCLRCHGSLTR